MKSKLSKLILLYPHTYDRFRQCIEKYRKDDDDDDWMNTKQNLLSIPKTKNSLRDIKDVKQKIQKDNSSQTKIIFKKDQSINCTQMDDHENRNNGEQYYEANEIVSNPITIPKSVASQVRNLKRKLPKVNSDQDDDDDDEVVSRKKPAKSNSYKTIHQDDGTVFTIFDENIDDLSDHEISTRISDYNETKKPVQYPSPQHIAKTTRSRTRAQLGKNYKNFNWLTFKQNCNKKNE